MSLEPGVRVGRFIIVARVGAGGLGEVYRAKDPSLGRDVAVKVLRPESAQDPGMRARFVHEARAVAAVRHPNVLIVHETGETAEGLAFMVTELLDGTTLRQRLRTGPSLELRLRWALALARALDAVHAVGIIHRDVKPDNVLIVGDDLKLLDFGIAKRDPAQVPTEDVGAPSFATGTGKVIGTPLYMAPEQSAGVPVDARLDQFAWGLVSYEMFGGAHPSVLTPRFSAATGFSEPPTALATVAPDLPFGVSAVVMKALSRLPGDRFATMSELCEVLARLLEVAARASANEVSTVDGVSSHPSGAEPPPRVPSSPEPASGPRNVAVLTFVLGAMAVLLVLSLGALGFILSQKRAAPSDPVVLGSPSALPPVAPAPPSSADAAASPVASAPPPVASTPHRPDAAGTAPLASPASDAAVASGRCACMLPSGAYAAHAICTNPAPQCQCKGSPGDICQVPWTFPGYECARTNLPGTPSQKTGDPCTGFATGPNDTNVRGAGVLSCVSCSGRRIYKGSPGTPCRGIDDYDGVSKSGTWECD